MVIFKGFETVAFIYLSLLTTSEISLNYKLLFRHKIERSIRSQTLSNEVSSRLAHCIRACSAQENWMEKDFLFPFKKRFLCLDEAFFKKQIL